MRDEFIRAIHSRLLLQVDFFSKEDDGVLRRRCAPMDYGPSRRAKEQNDRFHMWDYDSDTGSHVLSLSPGQIRSIEVLAEHFDPAEFVTWKPEWFIARNWGEHS